MLFGRVSFAILTEQNRIFKVNNFNDTKTNFREFPWGFLSGLNFGIKYPLHSAPHNKYMWLQVFLSNHTHTQSEDCQIPVYVVAGVWELCSNNVLLFIYHGIYLRQHSLDPAQVIKGQSLHTPSLLHQMSVFIWLHLKFKKQMSE